MINIFEIIDKTGRKIRLTKERQSYIKEKHPEVHSSDEIEDTLLHYDKIEVMPKESIVNFFKHFKKHKGNRKFMKTVVRYLNGDGFVITSYYKEKIT